MKDLGVRLARQKLLRFRPPDPPGRRFRRWLLVGALALVAWALLLSDHSVARLLKLAEERRALEHELEVVQRELAKTEREQPHEKLSDEEAGRILRSKHGYAGKGERVYVIERDSSRTAR